MTQHPCTFIVGKTVLKVKFKAKVLFVAIIGCDFFEEITKCRFKESLAVESQNFVVKCVWELFVPVLDEFLIGFRQLCDKLIVAVKPIIHAVVADKRLFCVYYFLHNQTKAHLVTILQINRLLKRKLFCAYLNLF